jgi:hypothetical protein
MENDSLQIQNEQIMESSNKEKNQFQVNSF